MIKESLLILFMLTFFPSCKENGELVDSLQINNELMYDSAFNASNVLQEVIIKQNEKVQTAIFYHNNKIRKMINYIELKDGVTPNQFVEFNENGDTLLSKSLFTDIFCVKDTISMNEQYSFKIVLTAHIFDSAQIYLCNFDEYFNLDTFNTLCNVSIMENLEARFKARPTSQGWNYVRAKVDNYQNYQSSQGEDSGAFASVYILDSFYVK